MDSLLTWEDGTGMRANDSPHGQLGTVHRKFRVLIVDDHPIVREGLTALLSAQPDFTVCGEAENIAEAMQGFDQSEPDIAVVDISLQDENGLELIRRMKGRNSSVPILVMSMFDEGLYAERALEAGAMGYLNKHTASRNIVAALRRILAGKKYLSPEMEERLLTRNGQNVVSRGGQGVMSLSNRELEVFRLIGTGLTTAEIAAKLHLSVKTVESHRQKIKLRLDLRTAAELSREAAHWVLQNG